MKKENLPEILPPINDHSFAGYVVLSLGIAFWFIENIHFGWNATPQSFAEHVCDMISASFLLFGVGYISATTPKKIDRIFFSEMNRWTQWFKNATDENTPSK